MDRTGLGHPVGGQERAIPGGEFDPTGATGIEPPTSAVWRLLGRFSKPFRPARRRQTLAAPLGDMGSIDSELLAPVIQLVGDIDISLVGSTRLELDSASRVLDRHSDDGGIHLAHAQSLGEQSL